MKFRVRTNVGVFRVEILDGNQSIAFLRQQIISGLRIQDVETAGIVLSFDLEGERRIGFDQDDKTISEVCGTFDGLQLFLDGKFERVEVKKAYIDSNSQLVKEGTLLKKILAPGEKREETIQTDKKNDPSPPIQSKKVEEDVKAVVKIPTQNTQELDSQALPQENKDANLLQKASMPIEGDSLLDDGADELDIRAPDESKKMQLIDNTAVNSPFLDAEDEVVVQRYMQQLSEAGLDEYQIHLECQQMRDELIAKRLHAQQSSPYDVHFHPAIVQSRLRKAEAKKELLLKQKFSTNPENGKLVSSDDGSLPSHQKSYIVPDIDSELPTKLKVPSFNKARTNISHTSSSTHHTSSSASERLSKVGEQVISNRDTKIVLPKRQQASSVSSKVRKQEVKRRDSPLGVSTGAEEELDDALAQAIKASLLDVPNGKVGAEDSHKEMEHNSRREDTTTSNAKTANDNNIKSSNVSSNRSSSLSSSSSGVAPSGAAHHRPRVIGPKAQHVLLQRQHEKNQEPAQIMPSKPSGQPTSSRSRSGSSQDNRPIPKHSDSKYAAGHKRPADDFIRPHLREHLHHNRNLPSWVAENVEVDTQDKLLAMAIANSLSDAGGPAAAAATENRNSHSAQARRRIINDGDDERGDEYRAGLHQGRDVGVDPTAVEYCEEDEMLARALHESMNGF